MFGEPLMAKCTRAEAEENAVIPFAVNVLNSFLFSHLRVSDLESFCLSSASSLPELKPIRYEEN